MLPWQVAAQRLLGGELQVAGTPVCSCVTHIGHILPCGHLPPLLGQPLLAGRNVDLGDGKRLSTGQGTVLAVGLGVPTGDRDEAAGSKGPGARGHLRRQVRQGLRQLHWTRTVLLSCCS